MDINDTIPAVIASQIAEATDAALNPPGPLLLHGLPKTPPEMADMFPPGVGDFQSWYVVIVGREPGLYGSAVEADAQVNGIPGQFRQKKTSRREALDFYWERYIAGAVDKINIVVLPIVSPAPVTVSAPTAQ
ncbi:hypothetical protein B0H17DRAFT_1132024 [Mycena rosella]|uniref:Ribonuclease H1 N-terminal domain-containing protein n=1 Tax=Mycena rosella TaxID=1033263 RepID=A0AAD7GH33_MYCRO|nr:hypothetical protein B0H17DRAFT_1132024 [Mycena rosella]